MAEKERSINKKLLQECFSRSGWGYEDLFHACGIAPVTIAAWMDGGVPNVFTVKKVVSAFNLRFRTVCSHFRVALADLVSYAIDPRISKMQKMREAGASNTEIAKRFGISGERVRQLAGNSTPVMEKTCLYCGISFLPKRVGKETCPGKCTYYYNQTGKSKAEWGDRRIASIASKIKVIEDTGCWELCIGINRSTGYANVRWEGKSQLGHRVMWQIVVGAIPKDKMILHTCDNPPCCNPAHLYIGTAVDNVRDRAERGRQGSYILGKKAAATIRAFYKSTSDLPWLAKAFNVHPKTIYNVVSGRTYTGVRKRRKPEDGTRKPRQSRILVPDQVRRIRDLYSHGNHTHRSLALMYAVSRDTVRCVEKRITYADVI